MYLLCHLLYTFGNILQEYRNIEMGNDGGDIPKRKQLVKQKSKVEIANAESIAMGRSRFCNLTNERLKQPLAICRLGCIYNYQNILAALVQKTLAEKYSYIRKLSDIKQVIIERAPKQSDNYFACPITKLQYNGFNKFVALWSCGHVLSRKAFKQIKVQQGKEQAKLCIICQTQYKEKDVIDLNLEGAQLEKRRIELLKKKQKKKKETEQNEQKIGQPTKKTKLDVHLNGIQRLDGQFRDVIRDRQKFKELFTKKE